MNRLVKIKIVKISVVVLVAVWLAFGLICVGKVTAVGEQSDVGVGFNLNSTLQLTLSSSELRVSHLAPGTVADSNTIEVGVLTNNPTGYVLSATVGNDATYNTQDLVHSDPENTAKFTSIGYGNTVSGLTDFADNTWGYAFSVDTGTTWVGYSGLPLYNDTENTAVLRSSDGPVASAEGDLVDFKIAAKAGDTQLAGEYSNVINFAVTVNPVPVTLASAYESAGATLHNGYYALQDMSATICSAVDAIDDQLQVIDTRDNKVYWIAKLKDGHCWMTQNLDLCIGCTGTAALTSENTDLSTTASGTGIYTDGYTTDASGVVTWTPDATAVTSGRTISGTTVSGWTNEQAEPYSAEGGTIYVYTSGTTSNDTVYSTLEDCQANHSDCQHYHVGNYYNWTAAIASNDSTGISTRYTIADNSVCPAGWRLPIGLSSATSSASTREFGYLFQESGVTSSIDATTYTTNGFNIIRSTPLFWVRGGYVLGSSLIARASYGFYWSSTVYSDTGAYFANFYSPSATTPLNSANFNNRLYGRAVRCVAR